MYENVVTNGSKCSRQVDISFVVVVTISKAQNPTKSIRISSLSCAPTQFSYKELDE
jgi:hypothetical protein